MSKLLHRSASSSETLCIDRLGVLVSISYQFCQQQDKQVPFERAGRPSVNNNDRRAAMSMLTIAQFERVD